MYRHVMSSVANSVAPIDYKNISNAKKNILRFCIYAMYCHLHRVLLLELTQTFIKLDFFKSATNQSPRQFKVQIIKDRLLEQI